MSDKNTKLESSAEVQALQGQLRPHFSANATGNGIDVAANTYEATLPEGLTIDQAKAFATHHSNLFPAAIGVGTEIADTLFKKDEELKELTVKLPLAGRGSHFEYTIERQAEVINPRDRTEVRTVYGNVTTKLVTAGSRNSSAGVKTARDIASERARAAYGKDE